MRTVLLCLALLAAAAAAAPRANAVGAYEKAWRACSNVGRVNAQERYVACTYIIEDGRATRRDLATAYSNRGLAHYENRDCDSAIADLTEAIRLHPRFGSAYSNRGLCHMSKRNYKLAVADFDEAIRIDDRAGFAFVNRGIAYMELGDLDRAIQDFDRALELKLYRFEAYRNRASAHMLKGDYEQAIRDVDAALTLRRDDPRALRQRCWIRAAMNRDLELALQDCTKSIGYVGFAATYTVRGFVRFRMGQFREAIADFDDAIKIDSNFARAYYLRGIAKLRLGDAAGRVDIGTARRLDKDVDTYYGRHGVAP